jgi:TetR/AcrR family transcriptional regulator, tetracycline repressor protein
VGRRAGQPPLTRERILAAALRLIDHAGLEALSMRRLGAELDVDPMAIYYHLPDKEAVVRGVIAQVFDEMPLPATTGAWHERVREWARTYHTLARAHPNLVLRIVSDPAAVAVAATRIDGALHSALEAAGLPREHIMQVADVIVDYINGFALAFASVIVDRPDTPAATEQDMRDSFEFGLDLILAGVRSFLPVHSAGRSR